MTVSLSPLFIGYQVLNHSGLPNAGGFIYVYQAGTSTPATTYTDSSGTIANTNPIQLNAAGYAPNQIWVISGNAYKFVVEDAYGSVLGTYDNIPGMMDAVSGGGATANRPIAPLFIGQPYFDTTLGQPIWCSSISPVTWVNAAGVSV